MSSTRECKLGIESSLTPLSVCQRHNLALLTNIPAPYRIPTLNYLRQVAGSDFRVVFRAPGEPRRSWKFPKEEMEFEWELLSPDVCQKSTLVELKSAVKVLLHLRNWQPSAVICGGYDCVGGWAAFFWCKLYHRRFVLWVESTARDHRRHGLSGQIRTVLKRLIVSQADCVAASGTASAAYMKLLGARQDRLFIAPFTGDPASFACQAAKIRPVEEKRERGFPGLLILYSGRLVRAKGVFALLDAFRNISRVLPSAGLLVVGHGPDEKEMKESCRNQKIERVFFEGPQPYERMPYYYALADVLALPTFSDTWGVVVNEAFACGVPVVVSRAAGACDDLIIDGETGFAIEPGDVRELAEKLLRVLRDAPLRQRMSANCRRLIQGYSAEACARGLLAAVKGCQEHRPAPAHELKPVSIELTDLGADQAKPAPRPTLPLGRAGRCAGVKPTPAGDRNVAHRDKR
jgi:glycosyltransferase involved in cell wall biosynthesis